jgi:predicted transposase YdaD
LLERYELERDARNKAEFEYYTLLNAAKKEGHEEGKAEIIKSMHDLGMSIDEIAKVCKLDID